MSCFAVHDHSGADAKWRLEELLTETGVGVSSCNGAYTPMLTNYFTTTSLLNTTMISTVDAFRFYRECTFHNRGLQCPSKAA